MQKTHIFDQKNNQKKRKFYRPTYPIFFPDRYRKQTISSFRPYPYVTHLRGHLM